MKPCRPSKSRSLWRSRLVMGTRNSGNCSPTCKPSHPMPMCTGRKCRTSWNAFSAHSRPESKHRQILRDLLGNAGYELTEAENGEEAIAAVDRRRPDLILMDIQLPVMDGYEATRRIRTNPDLKSVPIIAVTSYALAGDEDKALAAGCDGYVTKPYSPRDLLAKVRTYLASD